jgi:hypothetical protein
MFTNMVNNVKFLLGVIFIKKPNFTTTIDKELQEKFKSQCALKSVKMNEVIETFMKYFIEEKILYDSNENTIYFK